MERDGKPSLFCFALSQKRERPFTRRLCVRWARDATIEKQRLCVPSRAQQRFFRRVEQVLPTPPGTAGRKRAHGFREFLCKKIPSQFRNPEPRAHYAHARVESRNRAAVLFRNAAGIPPTLSVHGSRGVIMDGIAFSPSGARVRDIARRPFFWPHFDPNFYPRYDKNR